MTILFEKDQVAENFIRTEPSFLETISNGVLNQTYHCYIKKGDFYYKLYPGKTN